MAEKYTEAQKRATYKYLSKTVAIQIRVSSDQRERYQTLANDRGLSMTQLIIKLLEDVANNSLTVNDKIE